MQLRVLGLLCGLLLTDLFPCFGRQVPGPQALENVMQSDEATDVAEAEATLARPAGTLARPNDGVQHLELDNAWAEYNAAVVRAADAVRAAIHKQFERAKGVGELELAEKWQAVGAAFEKNGTLPREKETEKDVKAATAAFTRASDSLKKAYEQVKKTLTIDGKLPEARAAKDEWAGLAGQATERAAFLPKEGRYEFTQANDNARFLVEVKGDSIAICSWISPKGQQWWEEQPAIMKCSEAAGVLRADGLAYNTEQLRWNVKAGTAERDWSDGGKNGTAKCRVREFSHPLVGRWRYMTQGGHIADVEFLGDGTVVWHDRDRDFKATKVWSQRDRDTVLISDRRGDQGEKGWHVVHLPVARNEAVCDDWFAGPRTARLRRSP